MDASSTTPSAIARKSLSLLLNAVAKVGQNELAKGCGVDDATITRDKDKYWERFCLECAVAGVKLVPAINRCYPPEHLEHLEYFAEIGMKRMNASALEWDE